MLDHITQCPTNALGNGRVNAIYGHTGWVAFGDFGVDCATGYAKTNINVNSERWIGVAEGGNPSTPKY